ncbi:MAG: MBL fold metallo-hydrolase [Propionibacteriales bacterium]|nr:MBL fold metallo-hydrolase [Propionibacteriales bacterium]
MRLTVLGGGGAWPQPGIPCSGYLLEMAGAGSAGARIPGAQHPPRRVLLDPGYGTLGHLLQYVGAADVDAVFVSHRHPDHCADLNPLLRARVMGEQSGPLPVFAPSGAVDAVLALDSAEMMDGAYELHEFGMGDSFDVGPLRAETRPLPHSVPNAGVRLSDGRCSVTYTGDAGPSWALPELAEACDLLVAEATYVDGVPTEHRDVLSDARGVAAQARLAGVGKLMLTHLGPGTDPSESLRTAREEYDGPSLVARPGRVAELR